MRIRGFRIAFAVKWVPYKLGIQCYETARMRKCSQQDPGLQESLESTGAREWGTALWQEATQMWPC